MSLVVNKTTIMSLFYLARLASIETRAANV